MKYKAIDIKNWDASTLIETGSGSKWLPTRPENYRFMPLKLKLKLAWGVLRGKYDVLDWEQ